MTEIDHINTPSNLTELPQLIGFINRLCNLLRALKTKCCQQQLVVFYHHSYYSIIKIIIIIIFSLHMTFDIIFFFSLYDL